MCKIEVKTKFNFWSTSPSGNLVAFNQCVNTVVQTRSSAEDLLSKGTRFWVKGNQHVGSKQVSVLPMVLIITKVFSAQIETLKSNSGR